MYYVKSNKWWQQTYGMQKHKNMFMNNVFII
jgi:hypothetical protein